MSLLVENVKCNFTYLSLDISSRFLSKLDIDVDENAEAGTTTLDWDLCQNTKRLWELCRGLLFQEKGTSLVSYLGNNYLFPIFY